MDLLNNSETDRNNFTKPGSDVIKLFSSHGRSPGRTIVLPPALASALALALASTLAAATVLAKSLTLKFFL